MDNLEWMPMLIHHGKVFLEAEGLMEFIDNAIKKGNTPKREKEVLARFKGVIKQFEAMANQEAPKKPKKSFDA